MAHEQEFTTPTFKGGRFNAGAGLPVDVLEDLAVYAEILTDVAKHLFKQRHPDRRRVSRGFEDRMQLRLTGIRSGSQIAVLTRRVPDGELPIPDEYDEARDLFAEAIASAAESGTLPPEFPMSVVPKFGRLGQRLQPDELMIFARRGGEAAIYDRAARSRIIALGGQSYSARDEFVGYVADLNSHTGRFELRLVDGTALPGDYTTYWNELHTAQGSPVNQGCRVRVDADAEFTAQGQPSRLLVLHEVTVLDTWEWARARLAELAAIERGWFDGADGEPVSATVISFVSEFLEQLSERNAQPPHLFPTPEGGIQAEWRSVERTVSVEFEAPGRMIIHTIEPDGAEDRYEELDAESMDRAVELAATATS